MNKAPERHVFLDTMMYLHFMPIEDVDWLKYAEADSVVIVIPRITVQELDKHKDTHSSHKVKERARRLLSRLERWDVAEEAQLRENVRVKYIPFLPKVDMASLNLSKDSNDDILVASIIEYMNASSHDVLLITDDSTPRLTARALNIETLIPPQEWKLPEDRSPAEKKSAELHQMNQKLTNAIPVLRASFVGADTNSNQRLYVDIQSPRVYSEDKTNNIIETLRKKYPHYLIPAVDSEKYPNDPFRRFRAELKSDEFGIPKEEFDRANKEIDEYVGNFRKYCRAIHEWENSKLRTFEIEIEIANTGSAVAEDVDVSFHFPDGVRPVTIGNLPEKPKEPPDPEPPHGPIYRFGKPPNIAHIQSLMSTNRIAPSGVSKFSIRKTNSFLVEDCYERIKHGYSVNLRKLFVQFESDNDVKSFGIDYKLCPANLPDAITGRLDVIVNRIGT